MKKKLVLFAFLMVVSLTLLTPELAKAEDASGALASYNNPHDICDYFRGIAQTIVRETDNECLASIGEGEFKIFTQVYYSGNEWCAEVSNKSQVYQKKCIPKKNSIDSTDWNNIYFVAGFMIVLFILIGAINSIGKNKAPAKSPTIDSDLTATRVSKEGQSFDETNTRYLPTAVNGTADELEKLSNLKEKGIISKREFKIAKNKLLK